MPGLWVVIVLMCTLVGGLHSKQRFIKLKRDVHVVDNELQGLLAAQTEEIRALQAKHALQRSLHSLGPIELSAKEQFVLNVFDESSVPHVEAFVQSIRKIDLGWPIDIFVGHSFDAEILLPLRELKGCTIKFHSSGWQGGVTMPASLPAATLTTITRVSQIVQSMLESSSTRTVQLSFAANWSYAGATTSISTLLDQNSSVTFQPGPLFNKDAPFIDSGIFGGWEDLAVMAVHTGDRRVRQALVRGFQMYAKGATRVAYPLLSPKPAFKIALVYEAQEPRLKEGTLRRICHYPEPPSEGSVCALVIRCVSAKCGSLELFRKEYTQSLHEKKRKISDMLMPEKPWGKQTAWKLLGGGEHANTITTKEIPMYATRACLKVMKTCSCTHTALILHSYCTHTALILHSYCTHTALILNYIR
jgi:hypothetical protein